MSKYFVISLVLAISLAVSADNDSPQQEPIPPTSAEPAPAEPLLAPDSEAPQSREKSRDVHDKLNSTPQHDGGIIGSGHKTDCQPPANNCMQQ